MTGLPNTGICDREHTSDRHICENEKHFHVNTPTIFIRSNINKASFIMHVDL